METMELFGRVKRGDDITFDTVVYSIDGEPQDLTAEGWEVLAQLRPEEDSETVVTLDIDATALESSEIICSLSAEETINMAPGEWLGDIQVTSPDWVSSSETFLVVVVADVSRDE